MTFASTFWPVLGVCVALLTSAAIAFVGWKAFDLLASYLAGLRTR